MSSLQKQLQQLRERDLTLKQVTGDKVVINSLLFTASVSSAIDYDTIFTLAENSIKHLGQHDIRFQSFMSDLFSESNKRFDRAKLNASQNEFLSEKLRELLQLLSIYLLNEDALKVMEYLIRNYRVHQYEFAYVIIYFMHYHNTSLYTKLLQNVNLKEKEHFKFLAPSAARGELLPREVFVKYAKLDSHILEQLILYNSQLSKYLLVSGQQPQSYFVVGQGKQQPLVKCMPYGFLAALVTELLQSKGLTQNLQLSINQIVVNFSEYSSQDTITAAIMVLSAALAKNRQANLLAAQKFTDYLFKIFGKQRYHKRAIIQFFLFAVQKCYLQKFKKKHLVRLADLFHSEKELIQSCFGKFGLARFCVEAFRTAYRVQESLLSAEVLAEFLDYSLDCLVRRDADFEREPALRRAVLQQLFEDYFMSSEQEVYLSLLQKYFLADLIRYLKEHHAQQQKCDRVLHQEFLKDQLAIQINANIFGAGPEHKSAKDTIKNVQQINELLESGSAEFLSNQQYLEFLTGYLLSLLQHEAKQKVIATVLQTLAKKILAELFPEKIYSAALAFTRGLPAATHLRDPIVLLA